MALVLKSFSIAWMVSIALAGTSKNARADASLARLKGWLDAAVIPDGRALSTLTAIPFVFRTTNAKKSCEGVVKNTAAFAAWARCFREEEDLPLVEFQNGGELHVPAKTEAAPRPFRAFTKQVRARGTWQDAYFAGEGFNVWFRYLVTADGRIAALFLDWDIISIAATPWNPVLRSGNSSRG
jgi:hypothetical protein